MNPLFEAALQFQSFFERLKWPFCFIGGLSVLRWGEVRMTQDIDVSLFVGFGMEEKYIRTLLQDFDSRISDALDFAMDNRVLLLLASNGVAADISLAGLEYEHKMIVRSSLFEFASACSLRTCSAEDLIVLKAFADRPVDWIDIKGILVRQGNRLDQAYILKQFVPLAAAKEEPELVDKLRRMLDEP